MSVKHTYVPPETGHPKEIWLLFIVEMWERFSYYGMRALLVFYTTQTFLFSDEKSYAIYGSYTALVYLMPVFGGIIADRLLGYRKGVTVGALLMAAGHFCMAIESESVFYFALALLIVGNGFFKPNMSTIVGQLYPENDPRRDGGYTIFYMGVNVGAALAPLACGWVGSRYGWHWGFTLAGFGMVAGLLIFLASQHRLGGIADPPNPELLKKPLFAGINKETAVYIGAALVILLCWKLIQFTEPVIGQFNMVGLVLLVIGGGTFLTIFLGTLTRDSVTRHRLWVALMLTGVSVVFWACFEQGGSSLNLFADRNVNKVVLGTDVPAPVMQSINPIYIILLGPIFAWLWVALDRRRLNPTIPLKFGMGILLLGSGFAALYYGAWISRDTGIVPLAWLLLFYGLYTAGELCLSPVGLSMISKLAPRNMAAMMMGMWYLALAFANYAAGLIAQLTKIEGQAGVAAADVAATETVMVYGGVFGKIAVLTVGVGLVMSLISPLVHRGTHGIR
jgi:POT family proton-dependent oligopeptide transporter